MMTNKMTKWVEKHIAKATAKGSEEKSAAQSLFDLLRENEYNSELEPAEVVAAMQVCLAKGAARP